MLFILDFETDVNVTSSVNLYGIMRGNTEHLLMADNKLCIEQRGMAENKVFANEQINNQLKIIKSYGT